MDYNRFNIEEKYDSYKNITEIESKKILDKLNETTEENRDYDYYILRGKMLLKLDKVKEAIENLEKCVSFKVNDEVYDLLSLAFYKMKDYETALKYIDLSFTITIDEYVYNHKGKVLEKLGRLEEAFQVYYEGLKYALNTYSNYGDVEIYGENVTRIAGLLKDKYENNIMNFINTGDFYNLYENYIKLLKVIEMEEENDHYHYASNYKKIKYLELIEDGKAILINNDYFLEMLNIYKKLYKIEEFSEYGDKKYINKEYIDGKIKNLIDDIVDRTSLESDEKVILEVLDKAIKIKNRDYENYLYHKGFILLKLKRYEEGINVLERILSYDNANYKVKIQSYECVIKALEKEEDYLEIYKYYKRELSQFLKEEIIKGTRNQYLSLDERYTLVSRHCTRAINLQLDDEYWYDYTEELYLLLGENFETTQKNESMYKSIENYNKAIKIYDEVIKLKPKAAHGYYRKGRAIVLSLRLLNSSKAYLKDVKDSYNLDCFSYHEVIGNLNKAISLKSDNEKYFNLLSRTHFEIGEYDKAIDYMDRALKINGEDLYINLNKVYILIRNYKYTEAIDYLFKLSYRDLKVGKVRKTFLPKTDILNFLMGIFNVYPRQDKIYFIIAYYFYSIIEFQYNKAIMFINNAIEISDDERYYLLRAKINYRNKNYKEALKDTEEAINIDDHYDEAFTLKEECIRVLGEEFNLE